MGRWGLSRALAVGAVADRVGVAGIVEFAEVVDIVGAVVSQLRVAPFDFVSVAALDFVFVVLFFVAFVGIARGFRKLADLAVR